MTHALQSGSPAINRGDPAAPPQDQRGYGRAGVPDVGAFEFEGVSPSILGNIRTRAFVQTEDNVMALSSANMGLIRRWSCTTALAL